MREPVAVGQVRLSDYGNQFRILSIGATRVEAEKLKDGWVDSYTIEYVETWLVVAKPVPVVF